MDDITKSIFSSLFTLISVYFGFWLSERRKAEDEKQYKKALRVMFLATVYSFLDFLKGYSIDNWNNKFWEKNQLEIAKHFPKQAFDFASLIGADHSANRAFLIDKTYKLIAELKAAE